MAEAALTGESLPVAKDIVPIADEVGLGDRHNMIFSGTAATYGRGRAVVVATGMQTEMGRIAGMLKEVPAETTPLQEELDRVGRVLGLVVIAIAVVMIGTIFGEGAEGPVPDHDVVENLDTHEVGGVT
jgi:Ca2+-transporting ATPase